MCFLCSLAKTMGGRGSHRIEIGSRSVGFRTWTGTRSHGSNSTTSGGDSGCAAGVNNMTIEEVVSKNNYTLTYCWPVRGVWDAPVGSKSEAN